MIDDPWAYAHGNGLDAPLGLKGVRQVGVPWAEGHQQIGCEETRSLVGGRSGLVGDGSWRCVMARRSDEDDLNRTPPQPGDSDYRGDGRGDGGINDLPGRGGDRNECIKRHEFEELRCDVKDIKRSLIGRNPMKPDEDSVIMRLDGAEKTLRQMVWVLRIVVVAVAGAFGTWVWGMVTGKRTP